MDEGEALDAAVDLAETLAGFPQRTLRTDRAAVYDGLSESLETGIRVAAGHGSRSLETATEGAARFVAGEGRGGEGVPDDGNEDA